MKRITGRMLEAEVERSRQPELTLVDVLKQADGMEERKAGEYLLALHGIRRSKNEVR